MIKRWRNKLLLLTVLLAACAWKRPVTQPIEQVDYPAAAAHTAIGERQLLVLLPGIGGKLSDFERYGFIDAVRRHYPMVDVKLVDAHFGYYRQRLFIERLREDVIIPAQQQGYSHIHLAGISLGGYGTLLYLRQHHQHIASASLLAPYLGERHFYQHLLDGSNNAQAVDDELNLWPWLNALEEPLRQKIYLAYGAQDKFADANALLAGLLPDGHSFTIAGKHRWPVWQALWQQGLENRQLLPLTAVNE